jgi:hypothetical protein
MDSAAIDRIVANVVQQLRRAAPPEGATPASRAVMEPQRLTIGSPVITADTLADVRPGATAIVVGPRAVLTPSAWDVLRARKIEVVRDDAGRPPQATRGSDAAAKPPAGQRLLIVVRHLPSVARVWEDVRLSWRRELLGCPDDAAKLAISVLCRGESEVVVILAAQTHRAACLANRHERVKGVVLRDIGEIAVVRAQLRANVWCVDPTGRSWFELRRLLKSLE